MTKSTVTKKRSLFNSFIPRLARKNLYLKNLERDFARLRLKLADLQRQS